jgi:hypothetical protein
MELDITPQEQRLVDEVRARYPSMSADGKLELERVMQYRDGGFILGFVLGLVVGTGVGRVLGHW